MANLLKTTLAASATSSILTPAAAAIVVVAAELPVAVDCDLDGAGTWKQVSKDNAASGNETMELATFGQRLRVRNLSTSPNKVCVDER